MVLLRRLVADLFARIAVTGIAVGGAVDRQQLVQRAAGFPQRQVLIHGFVQDDLAETGDRARQAGSVEVTDQAGRGAVVERPAEALQPTVDGSCRVAHHRERLSPIVRLPRIESSREQAVIAGRVRDPGPDGRAVRALTVERDRLVSRRQRLGGEIEPQVRRASRQPRQVREPQARIGGRASRGALV